MKQQECPNDCLPACGGKYPSPNARARGHRQTQIRPAYIFHEFAVRRHQGAEGPAVVGYCRLSGTQVMPCCGPACGETMRATQPTAENIQTVSRGRPYIISGITSHRVTFISSLSSFHEMCGLGPPSGDFTPSQVAAGFLNIALAAPPMPQ